MLEYGWSKIVTAHPILTGGVALAALGTVTAWLRRVPWLGWSWLRRRLVVSIEVASDESWAALYWVKEWLAARPEYAGSCAVALDVKHGGGPVLAQGATNFQLHDGSDQGFAQSKMIVLPAPGRRLVRFGGRRWLVDHHRGQLQQGGTRETIRIQAFGGGRPAIDALVADVVAMMRKPPNGVQLLVPCGTGWSPGRALPRRPAASLSLPDDRLTEILTDLRRFLADRDWYHARGIPYRRGCLCAGPPGTGKSTLALVIASELGLSLAALSLVSSDLTDERLAGLMGSLPDRSILLVEDVDCVFRQRMDSEARTGVSMSGLLNALDGVGSAEGRILFLTSNHPDRLDPALVRPGRIDRRLDFAPANEAQAAAMYRWFFADSSAAVGQQAELMAARAERFGRLARCGTVTPARIQEHLVRHRDDPRAALYEAEVNGLAFEHGTPVPPATAVAIPSTSIVRPVQEPTEPDNPGAAAAAMLFQQIERMRTIG